MPRTLYVLSAACLLAWMALIEWRTRQMLTKADFDKKIAGLGDVIAPAVEDALTPILAPLVAKLNAAPEDYTDEAEQLDALPNTVATAVASAVKTALSAPVTTDTSSTTDGGATS